MDNEVVLYSSEVDEFMGVIQRTLLFQAEWESLLSAVPKSLVQMGSCFLAVYDTSNPAIAIGPAPDLLYVLSIRGSLWVSVDMFQLHIVDIKRPTRVGIGSGSHEYCPPTDVQDI